MSGEQHTSPPLAERMRPSTPEAFTGQNHIMGEEGILSNALKEGQLPSLIFWGPPGTGKTTLAKIIAHQLSRPFYSLSAVDSGVKSVREVIEKAKASGGAILFIDEIHRFNKSQQDALLSAVEDGTLTLIGATTENPSFEVISALLSRCQVYQLYQLEEEDLTGILNKAISEDELLSQFKIDLQEKEALLRLSGGDARKMLNLLELAITQQEGQEKVIDNEKIYQVARSKTFLYDKAGDQHYDQISAFIKSIRGSDPNAAVYWMARMLEGGEDPKFIARRLLISASEDIGNANPTALPMATSCFEAVERIGMPEARIVLSQTAVYLATSPKSNASYQAINEAMATVRKTGDLPVPLHLRNAPTSLMKDFNYGKDYQYDHDQQGHFAGQEFMPEGLEGKKFYDPGQNDRENHFRHFLKKRWGKKYKY